MNWTFRQRGNPHMLSRKQRVFWPTYLLVCNCMEFILSMFGTPPPHPRMLSADVLCQGPLRQSFPAHILPPPPRSFQLRFLSECACVLARFFFINVVVRTDSTVTEACPQSSVITLLGVPSLFSSSKFVNHCCLSTQ